MKGYPIFLKLEGKRCLVYGGGEVAARKIEALLKRGARVTCQSFDFSTRLKNLAKKNRSQLILKRSRGIQIDRAELVIAATSDRAFNARVAEAYRRKKIWVNAVDDPRHCDFYAAAIVERGPLQVAISTDGTSPLFAKRLREELEKAIPPSVGRLLEKLGRIREKKLRSSR